MTNVAHKIYRGQNPADLPAYSVKEVAQYLRVPYYTLYEWLRPHRAKSALTDKPRPLIQRPRNSNKLSFLNLIEGHVVKALKIDHSVPLGEIRLGIDYAEKEIGIDRVLVHPDLRTGARQIFIKTIGQTINLGRGGQLAIERMLDRYLARIEYENLFPITLYPFLTQSDDKLISISPEISFGKPIVSSAGVGTYVIAERYECGESKDEIADDYGISVKEVEEAIIYEIAA